MRKRKYYFKSLLDMIGHKNVLIFSNNRNKICTVQDKLMKYSLKIQKSVQPLALNFRHRASCIWERRFASPEKAFYILNQQMYFII